MVRCRQTASSTTSWTSAASQCCTVAASTGALSTTDEGGTQQLAVMSMQKGETRVSRSAFDCGFKITVTNARIAQNGVQATLVALGAGGTIVDGSSAAGHRAGNPRVDSRA